MSGTRLLSRKAPATEASARPSLLIVAHGECGGSRENRLPYALAQTVREHGEFNSVSVGFIRGEPTVEQAYDALPAGPATIFPLFMSDGYYVRRAIPERLGIDEAGLDGNGRQVGILTPIGLDRSVPEIVAGLAGDAISGAELEAADTTLLLVAHGSQKDPASRNATITVATALAEFRRFRSVEIAFLEEDPFVADQLNAVIGPAVAVGLFMGEGMHGGEDLPQAVRASRRGDIVIAPPLSQSPELLGAISRSLHPQTT